MPATPGHWNSLNEPLSPANKTRKYQPSFQRTPTVNENVPKESTSMFIMFDSDRLSHTMSTCESPAEGKHFSIPLARTLTCHGGHRDVCMLRVCGSLEVRTPQHECPTSSL